MNLRHLNDGKLVHDIDNLIREEREILTAVLHYLKEIERRRLFSELGYKSMFDLAVRRFGYSEDQAYRRISAMRLLHEIPEIEQKINDGEITLTHIGLAQSLFRHEKKASQKEFSCDEKIQLFEKISCKPTREAEKITLAMVSACVSKTGAEMASPGRIKRDRVHAVSPDQIELKFLAPASIQPKIEKLKGLLAHQDPGISLGELFEKLCDLGLSEWNPAKIAAPRKRRVITSPRTIAAAERREIFARAQSRCENCGSEHALQIDHILPFALAGASSKENLRLLCRSCNQRAAIRTFGLEKMERHLRSQ
jgi:hypothetical protein